MIPDFDEHRFVQIYQACESITTNYPHIRETLENVNSEIATSHVCEKVYALVIKRELDLLETIQTLQNLILTSNFATIKTLFARLITRLLIHNENLQESEKVYFYYTKTDDRKVHPFTVIIKQKPLDYYILLDEVDYLFREKQNVISILGDFINSLFLTQNKVDTSAFLTRLMNNTMIIGNENPVLMTTIYKAFVEILHRYPMQNDQNEYFKVVDYLLWMNVTLQPFIKINDISINDILFSLLDRMLSSTSFISYLHRFEKIMQAGVDDGALDVIWCGLSLTLLQALSLDEQILIMGMMQTILERDFCHISILRVGYLPLNQLLSELSEKDATHRIMNLKRDTLDMIGYLEYHKSTTTINTQGLKKLQDIMDNYQPYGLLTHLFVYLSHLYNNISSGENEHYYSDSQLTLELNMLFSTPFFFSEDQGVQCQNYSLFDNMLDSLEDYKFAILLMTLRLLRLNSDKPRIITLIFEEVLPGLTSVRDPIMTSKVVQVLLSCINSNNNSNMACLAVKTLTKITRFQSRPWQELKRVFSEWVLRRKSVTLRRRVDLSNTGPIKMELVILTSMRDLCNGYSDGYAHDLLPMVISLLHSCQDLSMASLSIILSIINNCIKLDVMDARSIWNITVVYLAQFAFDQGIKKSLLLVQQLCRFFSIAGAKNDISETYVQFKEQLLNQYLLPLLESEESSVVESALAALSSFPVQDIKTILPEKVTDYVKKVTPEDDHTYANHALVLSSLVSDELDHMGRGLFKDSNTGKQRTEPINSQDKRIVNDGGHPVGERELQIRNKFTENWDNARVAPGLRSGYAIAMLHMIDLPSTPKIKSKDESWDVISKSKWYRFMITQFTDVSLTDHLLLRISSVGSWDTFFKNTLLHDSQNNLEAITGLLTQDLMARLERSTVPGVTCNIALAITGLVSAMRSVIPSFAASCATEIIQKFMTNYINLAGSPLSHSAHLMSEEVQFAARFTLGYLSPCIISDEKLLSAVYNNLIESATSNHAKFRNIDTTVDLVQFANGYAAGHLVAELASYPSMTESIEKVRHTGTRLLLEYCGTQTISDSRVMGILMGLASGLKPELMKEELVFAIESLQLYLSGQQIGKGRLLGSLWLCAVGAKEEDHINYEISGLIESALASASSDLGLSQHFYHFTVCYAQIQYHTYLFADASSDRSEQFYSSAFTPLLDSIETDDASSNYRIASLFGIGSLFGLSYISTNRETVYLEAQRYSSETRKSPLEKISQIAGIMSRSAPTGNLKSGRVAAAVCGKVIEHVLLLRRVLDPDHEGESKSDSTALSLLSNSSEPANYNRLNSNTSYLRAVFDQLVHLSSTTQEKNLEVLIQTLIKTRGPLPAVNWFNILIRIVKISPGLQKLCYLFAATHGKTSFSLSEFTITQVTSIVKNINPIPGTDPSSILFTSEALKSILKLSGLTKPGWKEINHPQRRGMNAVVQNVTISPSRITELFQLLCQKFQLLDDEQQHTFLASCEFTDEVDEEKQKLIASIRGLIYQTFTLPSLNDPEANYKKIEYVTDTSVTDVQQVFSTSLINDWKELMPKELVFNRIIALSRFFWEKPTSRVQQATKYVTTAMTYLVGLPFQETEEVWETLYYTLSYYLEPETTIPWIIRLFDAYVVFLSSITTPEEYNDEQSLQNIQRSMHGLLINYKYSPLNDPITKIQTSDTVFMLTWVILNELNDNQDEIDQIVKRVFKLMDMAQELGGSLVYNFFQKVALSLPKKYITQYENRY